MDAGAVAIVGGEHRAALGAVGLRTRREELQHGGPHKSITRSRGSWPLDFIDEIDISSIEPWITGRIITLCMHD